MLTWATLITFCLGSTFAFRHATPQPDRLFKRQSSVNYYRGPVVPSFNISMPIDHFNSSDTRTYNNRYWVNDTFYQPGGPIFFYDMGEEGVSNETAAQWLAETNGTTAVMALARQYHGLAILWELRYYGLSLPFPFSKNFTSGSMRDLVGAPASWQYSTVEQGLEDVVYFANNMSLGGYQPSGINMTQLLPNNTPWVYIGGSYPGGRALWMRVRNPETIYAAWASCAPTQAQFDGSTYYNGALRSLPSNCSTDVEAIVKYADEILSGNLGEDLYTELQRLVYVEQIIGRLFTPSAKYNLNMAEAFSTLSEMTTTLRSPLFDYYQGYGPRVTTHVFCDALESYTPGVPGQYNNDSYIAILTNPGTSSPSDSGFLATHNNNLTLGLEAYLYAVRAYNTYFRSFFGRIPTPQAPPDAIADASSWAYTVLTQFGRIPGTDVNNITIASKYLNISFIDTIALVTSFSNATVASIPKQPNFTSINQYGGWNINPANTMFTDGELDPWRDSTVYSLASQDGAPGLTPTTVVPACGMPPNNPKERYGVIYPGAVHVPDLKEYDYIYGTGNSTPNAVGIDLFIKALDVWLPCFGKEGANGAGNLAANGTQNTTGTHPYTSGASSARQLSASIPVTGALLVAAGLTLLLP